jgi:hypothetical protein
VVNWKKEEGRMTSDITCVVLSMFSIDKVCSERERERGVRQFSEATMRGE